MLLSGTRFDPPLPTEEWGIEPVWLWFTANLHLRSRNPARLTMR